VSILVAGNYCHDTLLSNDGEHRSVGGSSAYAASVLHALGETHDVIAKVGDDFLYGGEVLRAPRYEGPQTTAFVDDYRRGGRRQRVTAVGAPIRSDDIIGSYEVGIACGIAGEIGIETLSRLRSACATLVADAQSLLREVTPSGEVRLRPLAPETGALLDVLKAGKDEARFLDIGALRLRTTLLLTDGALGSTVVTVGEELRIPPFPATEVDPTGAGDCFLSGFAAGLRRGLPLQEAARLATWCGARAVESRGVPRPESIGAGPR
jgi:1D-myo-inositol 3-kinase